MNWTRVRAAPRPTGELPKGTPVIARIAILTLTLVSAGLVAPVDCDVVLDTTHDDRESPPMAPKQITS